MPQTATQPHSRQENATHCSKRSCIRCSQRKVRCDRAHPCGKCLQAGPGVACVYPGNKRAARKLKRPPIADILAHLKELDAEVQELRSSSGLRGTENAERVLADGGLHQGARSRGAGLQARYRPDVGAEESMRGRRGTSREYSRYVGDDASMVLGNKLHELQEVCGPRMEEDKVYHSPKTGFGSPLVPSTDVAAPNSVTGSEENGQSPIEPLDVKDLWHIYEENVAPLIPILHKPSTKLMIDEACIRRDSTPQLASQALKLTICFASIVSANPGQCLSITGQERETSVRQYRAATEQALARANLISTRDIRVLQAATLFLLCLRAYGDSRSAWAGAAVVVRVAQRQGAHRDGQHLSLSPFDTEMRRRLWWHICILDMLCSEDQGTETQIRPGMFDTQFPVNANGDELFVDMESLPEPQQGFTDITLCILHCEMMTHFYSTTVQPLFPSSSQPHTQNQHPPTNKDRANNLSALASRLEEQYLDRLKLNSPIQWLTGVIARLMLSKAWLVVRLDDPPAFPNKDATSTSTSTSTESPTTPNNDEIFRMAIETLKFANLMQTNGPTAQWAWLCKSYKHQHVMAYILSELCTRPISAETTHAWEVAREFYDMWLKGDHPADSMLHRPLARLMERTRRSRETKLRIETLDTQAGATPLTGDWLSGFIM
ncbi:fungal-specific transcription factor domain-containing protein [Aspergillus insuetus]